MLMIAIAPFTSTASGPVVSVMKVLSGLPMKMGRSLVFMPICVGGCSTLIPNREQKGQKGRNGLGSGYE